MQVVGCLRTLICKIWLPMKNEILVGRLLVLIYLQPSVTEINAIKDRIATSMWQDYTCNA